MAASIKASLDGLSGTLQVGGTDCVTFTPTATSFPDGSAAAPSITNTGDENTGLFFPAEGNVAIAVNGGEVVRVDSSGAVSVKGALQSYSAANAVCLSMEGSVATITATRTGGNYSTLSLKTAGANSSAIPVERVNVSTEGVVSLTQGQLKFPATQNPSADPNTLDDYEEGTWTPTLTNVGGTGLNVSGYYTKIGRLVVAQVTVTGTNVTTTGGSSTFSTPPSFTPANTYACGAGINGASSSGIFHVNSGASSFVADVTFAASTLVTFTISYTV